jgi:PPM family protein phosphatase
MTTTYAGQSDLGCKRTRNDDRWGADPALRLYMVADGVGSTSHGDVAAGLVVEQLPTYVARHLLGADLRDAQAAARLGRAVVELCDNLYTRSQTDPQLASADTTLVAAVVSGSRAVIAHLGDSRAYLYRDRRVQQLTSDHTIVQAVVDAGEISPEQAAHHPQRSVVIRHVLMTPPAKPDVSALDLQPGDRILLCSDGLHGVVDDAALAAILTDHPDPADACRVLIEAANHAGGPDNITTVVVNADPGPPAPPPRPGPIVPNRAAPPPPAPDPTVRDAVVPPPPPPRAPQQPGDPNLAVTQRRSPEWPPAPPTRPAGPPPPQIGTPPPQPPRRRRRGVLFGLLAVTAVIAVVVLLLAIAGITGYLQWPHPPASQTPTGQPAPAPPSAQTVQPAPPAGSTVLPFTGLKHPEGVAVDIAGNVYVVINDDNGGVLKLAAGSSTPSMLPFTGLKNPYGVAVDTAGNVYVTDAYGGGRVMVLPAGSSTPTELLFGKSSWHRLLQPAGVALDSVGNIYVADTMHDRVVQIPPGRSSQYLVPFTGLKHPEGVAVDTMGNVYVADQGNNRVLRVSAEPSTQVALPFNGLERPEDVAVDAAGSVYVTDSRNHQVVKLAAGSWTPTVLPFTGLGSPTGVAVDATGSVYVADNDNNRVVKLPAG